MNIKPGDFVFVKGTGWIARIIKWVTKSKYSHVAIYVGDGKVIEAQALRPVGFQRLFFYEGYYEVKPLPEFITLDELQAGLHWLFIQRGRRYSYWSDFVILVRSLFGISIPWREGAAIICSRLARDFAYRCSLPIPDSDMSPEDLAEWLDIYRCKAS